MRGIKSYWSGRCGGVSRHLLPMLLGRWLGALFVSGLILGSLLFAPTDRTEYAQCHIAQCVLRRSIR
jgi:hypothetical protein